MRSGERLILSVFLPAVAALFLAGCNSTAQFSSPSTTSVSNVMAVTVNGSLCSDTQYANEPCVSVTICQPGTSNCQTIDDILLDTGSFGLRIFSSVVSVPLDPASAGGGADLTECVQFGDGSSEWGPVEYADVVLAGEPAVRAPIELIDSSYASPPDQCTSAESTPATSPSQSMFNGILGVGLLNQDCGDYCSSTTANGQYYACSGGSCSETATSVQVQNPVALLPSDNNGVILELPSVSSSGSSSLSGSLILGIGTQSNNAPSGATAYSADDSGDMSTLFSSYSETSISSFIDSGSSAFFIPEPTSDTLPDCNSSQGGSHGSEWAGQYCPSSTQSFSATNIGNSGSPTGSISFQIGNSFTLHASGNAVFADLGASADGEEFDWGLPFFFGRNVYIGIESTTSTLGSGPYWAY